MSEREARTGERRDRAAARVAAQRRAKRRRTALFPAAAPAQEIELITMLFASVAAIVLIAGATGAIVIHSVLHEDFATAAVSSLIVLLALARIVHVRAFRARTAGATLDLPLARRWEAQYAWGSYLVSGAVGLANFRALSLGDPVIAMVVIGILVVYVFSLVLRVSIRPKVCAASTLAVLIPTAAGLVYFVPDGTVLTPAFSAAALAMILAIIAASAFEMMRYMYCMILDQLVARRDLTQMARIDPLTSLPNRIRLRERFDEEIAGLGKDRGLAILYVDLDHFKAVNDGNGHQAGDALLRQVANRMTMCVRAGDMVARLGGDEFVIVQAGIASEDEAADLARRVIASISEPYTIDTLRLRVGATVGIALAPRDGRDLDGLLSSADAALYRAKNNGRGSFEFWAEAAAPSARQRA